jgi:ribonuclease HI
MPSVSSKLRALAKKSLLAGKQNIPVSELLNLLASHDTDISDIWIKYPSLKEPELRKALRNVALLLNALEDELNITKAAKIIPQNTDPHTMSLPDLNSQGDLASAKNIKLFTDGAAKGNPGPAGIAFVITDMEGRILDQDARSIGTATNNVAEYQALIAAMKRAIQLKKRHVFAFSDSELMVNQVNGSYKVKTAHIKPLVKEIIALRKKFDTFQLTFIQREQNTVADKLASKAAINNNL